MAETGVILLIAAALLCVLPSSKAECNSPYEITTSGVSSTPPAVADASQGVPWFPEQDNTRSFRLNTEFDARMILAPSPQITGTDYIVFDFDVETSNQVTVSHGTDSGATSPLPNSVVSGNTNLFVQVNLDENSLSINTEGGGGVISHKFSSTLPNINFILVQTNTDSDSETSTWMFCEDVLMKLDLVDGDPDGELDDDDFATCPTATAVGTSHWLKIDLGSIYDVQAVLLKDGATMDLNGAEIKIGTCDDGQSTAQVAADQEAIVQKNKDCGSAISGATTMDQWIFTECSITGQFVYVYSSTATFDVCALQVWGVPSTAASATVTFSEAMSSDLESVTPRTITVERGGDTSSCVYYSITSVDGTATSPDDFTFVAADITTPTDAHSFDPDDDTPQEFSITIDDEAVMEDDETFGFELTDVEGGELGPNPSTTLTIEDNDYCYSWDKATYSVLESDGMATPVLTKRGYTKGDSTACVMTSVTGVTTPAATPGAGSRDDFTALPQTQIEFAADDTEENVEVEIIDDVCLKNEDDSDDFDESFKVVLDTSCTGVVLCTDGIMETEVTIDNDDAIYRFLTADAASVSETDGKLTLVIEREGARAVVSPAISIQSQPSGTGEQATAGDDYTELNTQVSIGAGLTTASFEVDIEDDKIVEAAVETFNIVLGSNLDMCAVDQTLNSRDVNIEDNDCFYSIDGENDDGDSVVEEEINENAGTLKLTINCERDDNLELAHSGYVDVNVEQITGKNAIADEDFESSGSSPLRVYFTPGSYVVDGDTGKDTAVLPIDIYDDNAVEETTDEMFEATLADSSGEFRGATKAEVTIVDNDAVIGLQETSISVRESEMEVTVTLFRSGDLTGSDSVRLFSRGSTATSGSSAGDGDYMNINEVITFDAGQTTVPVKLTIYDDDKIENDESFMVLIVAVDTRDLTVDPEKDELIVTIQDNDCLFSLEIDDDQLVVSENNNGNQPSIAVTVRRNGFTDQVSSITVKTENVGTPILSRDDATANVDYISLNEELVFQPGVSERTATIEIMNDDRPELSEVFLVSLIDAQCDVDGANRKVITILDDDEIVIRMANNEEVVDEHAGEVVITLVRTGSQAEEDTVLLSVSPTSVGDNKAATPGADYQEDTYQATFAANSGDASVSIPIFDDNLQEQSPETFVVSIVDILGSDSAAEITPNVDERKTAVYIEDNDDLYNLRETRVSVSESTGSYTTYVERVGAANTLGTVYVKTEDGTASSPGDYSPIPATTLSFPPGTRSQPITVEFVNDKIEEPSKNFILILASDDNSVNIGQGVTSFTIIDDDFPISFKDSDATVCVNEGESVTITVQRTRSDYVTPGQPASVSVMSREIDSTSNGAATPGEDFDSVSEVVQFSASGREVDVTVNTRDDDVGEEEEKFELYLSDPSPSNTHDLAYPSVLTVCIRDDDGGPSGGDGGGDGGTGEGDTGDGDGVGLSQVSIILIGGGVGLVLLLGILGLIGCFAVARLGGGGGAPPPPAYTPNAANYSGGQPRVAGPPRPYYNQGYRA